MPTELKATVLLVRHAAVATENKQLLPVNSWKNNQGYEFQLAVSNLFLKYDRFVVQNIFSSDSCKAEFQPRYLEKPVPLPSSPK